MDTILAPLYEAVSWIMIGWHWLLAPIFGDGGITWSLSIIGLVVVIRILLIPLFVRQIKASRALQLLQPQVREIQQKYAGDRERASQELMKLYKDTGTNPFASCMPILLQAPIFFALFRVLDGIARERPRGAFQDRPEFYESAQTGTIFGAPITETFLSASTVATQIVAIIMVLLMTLTTFITQRQLMRKNMPEAALQGPYAQQQKIMLYVLPLIFAFSGVSFPLGVVLYWLTSNVWSMGQQFYVIRRMPAPGTPAEEAYRRRQQAKAGRHGKQPVEETPAAPSAVEAEEPSGSNTRRQQPKRSTRSQRRDGTKKKRKK